MADHGLTDDAAVEEDELGQAYRDQLDVLRVRVDAELRAARPDRYEPGADFLDLVAERVSDYVQPLTARHLLVHSIVRQREGQATRRVNRFLKGVAGVDGQYALPLDWYLYSDEPVALMVPTVESGEIVGYRRERVALRAVTSVDWTHFTQVGRVEAQHRFDAEMRMYDAADWCADQQGAKSFCTWAQTIAPVPVGGVA